MQPAVRFSLDDVTELPEKVERTVDIPMGVKQTKLYQAMKQNAIAMSERGEITAMNAGAVMSKLLQISLGFVYREGGEVVTLDGNARMDAVIDDIMACQEKVLVFAPYKHVLSGIAARLSEEGIDHAVVSGDTPERVRSQVFGAFQNTSQYKVLAAHPACLAHGVTLTAASMVQWFGPTTSLETFEQANARIRRVGQRNKQLFQYYQSTPAEKRIYKLLEKGQRVQNDLLAMFQEGSN